MTPPEGRPSQPFLHDAEGKRSPGWSSPPQDTQANTQPLSQLINPLGALSEDVNDEVKEGVWGYLMPLDQKYGKTLVLKKRNACPMPDDKHDIARSISKGEKSKGVSLVEEEDAYEQTKFKGVVSGGYLIGRHPECGS